MPDDVVAGRRPALTFVRVLLVVQPALQQGAALVGVRRGVAHHVLQRVAVVRGDGLVPVPGGS